VMLTFLLGEMLQININKYSISHSQVPESRTS
jgi:hypothetical protein